MTSGGEIGNSPEGDGTAVGPTTPEADRNVPLVEAAMAMWQQGGSGVNPDLVKNIRPEHIDKAHGSCG